MSAKQIKESEARFSRFAEMSDVGMWIMGPDESMIFANRAWWKDLPGLDTAKGLEGWITYVSEESRPTLRKHWSILVHEKIQTSYELQLTRPWYPPGAEASNGMPRPSNKWILVTAAPELDDDGELKWIWGCNTDIRSVEDITAPRIHLIFITATRSGQSCSCNSVYRMFSKRNASLKFV